MLIISGSNVVKSKTESQSLVVAKRIAEQVDKDISTEIIDLRDYEISSCTMCEGCALTSQCQYDDDFNKLVQKINNEDTVIFIIPHYACIPSKIVALFEKIQEIAYLNYCQGGSFTKETQVGVIAHGGMTEDYETTYINHIIEPFCFMAGNVGYKMINNRIETPLCFGVKKYLDEKEEDGYCFKKEDNIDERERIINLLVEAL